MEASARHRKRASSSSLQHPSRNFGPSLSHNNHILKRNRSSSNLQAIGEILESTVVVKNLASSFTSADELRDFFQNYGDVSHVRLVPEQSYGLVTFDAKEIAHGVIVASNSKEGITMGNSKRKVQISWAVSSSSGTRSTGSEKTNKNKNKKYEKRVISSPKAAATRAGREQQHVAGKKNEKARNCVESRLFISALSSAVASTNPSSAPPLPPPLPPPAPAPLPLPPLAPTIPDHRQVIAYDDWL